MAHDGEWHDCEWHDCEGTTVRFVLASASPARLATLEAAGIRPEVIVSGVEEHDQRDGQSVVELVTDLAEAMGRAVVTEIDDLGADADTVVLACDSLLDFDGQALGKPAGPDAARERWRSMRGRTATLHTGHAVTLLAASGSSMSAGSRTEVASTEVTFAEVTDAEIDAYVATGEPLEVAGAFTIDGLGGAFVTGVHGDPHNVVGVSLPLLRRMLAELGVQWPVLWAPASRSPRPAPAAERPDAADSDATDSHMADSDTADPA